MSKKDAVDRTDAGHLTHGAFQGALGEATPGGVIGDAM